MTTERLFFMSDNVSDFKVQPKKTIVKRILLFVLIGLLVIGVICLYVFRDVLNLDAAKRFLRYLRTSDEHASASFTFDASNANQYANFRDGLAVASTTGLSSYDKNGSEIAIVQTPMMSPAIRTGGRYVMAFDAGGTKLNLMTNRAGSLLELSASAPILDADLAEDGSVCYSTSDVGYKSVLCVYNSDQQLIYRWLSSSQYMPVCAVSEKAEYLAATTLGQRDGMFETGISIYRTDSEDVFKTIPMGSELIYDLSFWDKSTLLAVGEQSSRWIGMNGATLGTYSYNGAYLKDYDAGGDGFLTLVLNMYKAGNRYSVITVDSDGVETGRLSSDVQILDFSADGKYVAVLSATKLSVYTQDMKPYAEADNLIGATNVIMRADGSCILISGDHGSVFVP